MRIAFLSHEFPPETGGGGIGTYLDQVAHLLGRAGHAIEVICGTHQTAGSTTRPDGVRVHRVKAATPEEFREAVVPVFSAIHAVTPIDVIEGNDFDAPANALKQAFPAVPCVVKLHTPRFVIDELHHVPPAGWTRWRMMLGALRRGRWPARPEPIRASRAARAELHALKTADGIAAPSQAIADTAVQWTPQAAGKISVFPYPYVPVPELLSIPAASATNRITYLGRLEERKGVIDLAAAIPPVLAGFPSARFRIVGRAMNSPRAGLDMRAYLERKLKNSLARVEFTGALPPAEIPRIMSETDILITPSHWESFGLVCCEGLAAARGVIGSANGGMAEILDQGACGLLVPPGNPAAIASAISRLLAQPDERIRLGLAGRRRVLETYSPGRVLPLQLACYEAAIAACRARN